MIISFSFSVTTTDMTLPPSSSRSGPDGQSDNAANLILPIIGGVVGGIASILMITVIAVVILFVVCGRRGLNLCNFGSHDERIYDLPADYEKPIAPPVETIPPRNSFGSHDERIYDLPADYEKPIAPPVETIPPRIEMNAAYEQAKSFNMTDNSAYTDVVI